MKPFLLCFCFTAILLLAAISAPATAVTSDMLPVTYYAEQDDPAFAFLQKRRIRSFMTDHFTPATLSGIENQVWNYNSFTGYSLLDSEGVPKDSGKLYYCTFSADGGRYGYIVVEYFVQGPAIQNHGIFETPYLYDLNASMEAIREGFGQLDMAVPATAIRARLDGDEIILFTGSGGEKYAFYLDSFTIKTLGPASL